MSNLREDPAAAGDTPLKQQPLENTAPGRFFARISKNDSTKSANIPQLDVILQII